MPRLVIILALVLIAASSPASAQSLDRLRVPPGFKVEMWATDVTGARMMTLGDKGTVFVGTMGPGRVYAITDRGGRREVKTVTQGLQRPNGVAFRGGALYVMAINRVLRFDGIEDRLDSVPPPADLSAAFALPGEVHHGWKFLAFGPDSKLYVPVGAPCNVCRETDTHAHIRRYNPDGSGMEIVARGVRNTVGFDFHPRTGELWFTDNGRDMMGDDLPEDELNRVSRAGEHFGFPHCHARGVMDPEFGRGRNCDGVTLPVALMGPHAAAIGMRFYTGRMFPAEYRDRVFVARHGSWNRSRKFGYDVVTVTATSDGRDAKVEPFLTGFLDTASNTNWGRPSDVQVLPDGSLLVSDDYAGAIYRITYGNR